MAFTLFKTRKKETEFSNVLKRFTEIFTENQKKSIIRTLYIIANSDGEFDHKEQQHLTEIANILEYELSEEKLKQVMSIEHSTIFESLKNLNEEQKDWYIIIAFGMVHADGKTVEIELEYLDLFLSKMDISVERFDEVVMKYQVFSQGL